LRKAQASPNPLQVEGACLNGKEIELVQKMNDYAAVVKQAGKDYSPSGIANYCYELTKEFNQFYHDYSILGADTNEQRQLRLCIARNVAKTLKNGMALLGIEVPERM
jgi:arginyl-tRNA synthetase